MKKIKTSWLILTIIITILAALFLIFFDYFLSKKNIVYSKMNLKLFESEKTENIKVDEEEKVENDDIEEIDKPVQDDKTNVTYNYIGMLEIPKINLKKGFLEIDSPYNKVDFNVTVVNTSNMPDVEAGNLILAGHNGNAYNSYFGKLHKLKNGDVAYIYYNGVKYEYTVVNMYEIEKTGYASIYRDFTKNCLTLITCKDNSDTKQLVYILEITNKTSY